MNIKSDNILLAVYGTLKYGYYNHTKYLRGVNPVFEGYINIKGVLITNGSYPLLIGSKNYSNIYIEVYSLSQNLIYELDALEAPYNLHRESVEISELKKSVDIYLGPIMPIPEDFILVKNGNWQSTKPFREIR
ncbi:MAG: hypothetical protein HeimC3_37410 [Candidatus Heimdallarchaeota archaeon LC_3]|nr:MAG: hypothetical protein HeimC3_37410 [Candidatus Heimdallarchaeota archaeon LC_3]